MQNKTPHTQSTNIPLPQLTSARQPHVNKHVDRTTQVTHQANTTHTTSHIPTTHITRNIHSNNHHKPQSTANACHNNTDNHHNNNHNIITGIPKHTRIRSHHTTNTLPLHQTKPLIRSRKTKHTTYSPANRTRAIRPPGQARDPPTWSDSQGLFTRCQKQDHVQPLLIQCTKPDTTS